MSDCVIKEVEEIPKPIIIKSLCVYLFKRPWLRRRAHKSWGGPQSPFVHQDDKLTNWLSVWFEIKRCKRGTKSSCMDNFFLGKLRSVFYCMKLIVCSIVLIKSSLYLISKIGLGLFQIYIECFLVANSCSG